jgi:transposase-like protein
MAKCYFCGGALKKYERRQRTVGYGLQKYVCTKCGRKTIRNSYTTTINLNF